MLWRREAPTARSGILGNTVVHYLNSNDQRGRLRRPSHSLSNLYLQLESIGCGDETEVNHCELQASVRRLDVPHVKGGDVYGEGIEEGRRETKIARAVCVTMA
jgi:hypothetical protein